MSILSPSPQLDEQWLSLLLPLRSALRKVALIAANDKINNGDVQSAVASCLPLLKQTFQQCHSSIQKLSTLFDNSTEKGSRLHEAANRVVQELYALLVSSEKRIPPKYYLLCAAVVRELSIDEIPQYLSQTLAGDLALYPVDSVEYIAALLTELNSCGMIKKNIRNFVCWVETGNSLLTNKMYSGNKRLDDERTSSPSTSFSSSFVSTPSLSIPQIFPSITQKLHSPWSTSKESKEGETPYTHRIYPHCKLAISMMLQLVMRRSDFLEYSKHVAPVEAMYRQTLLCAAVSDTQNSEGISIFSFFRGSYSGVCAEMDGTPCRSTFTIFNICERYSFDQLLNMQVFSCLYEWIVSLYGKQIIESRRMKVREDMMKYLMQLNINFKLKNETNEEREELNEQLLQRYVLKDFYETNKSEYWRVDEVLVEAITTYCIRLLDQIERDSPSLENPSSSLSSKMMIGEHQTVTELEWTIEFIDSVLHGAVRLLDVLCMIKTSLVLIVMPSIKKVYTKVIERQGGCAVTTIVQFFLNHGNLVMFPLAPPIRYYFGTYVNLHMRDPFICLHIFLFLQLNCKNLQMQCSAFTTYFPAILKLLACHPRTLESEWSSLLPEMVTSSTFVEVFHCILDLPFTSFFAELMDMKMDPQQEKIFANYNSLKIYVTRNERSNRCVWDENREYLRNAINLLTKSFQTSPLVCAACDIAPTMLDEFVRLLPSILTEKYVASFVEVVFHRFLLLYPIGFHINAVQSKLMETVLDILKKWPKCLLDLRDKLCTMVLLHLLEGSVVLAESICYAFGEYVDATLTDDIATVSPFFFVLLFLLENLQLDASGTTEHTKQRLSANYSFKIFLEFKTYAEKRILFQLNQTNEVLNDISFEEGNTKKQMKTRIEDVIEEQKSSTPKNMKQIKMKEKTICIIISAITKLALKYPEFSPLTIRCFRYKHSTMSSGNFKLAAHRTRVCMEALLDPPVASTLLCASHVDNCGEFSLLDTAMLPLQCLPNAFSSFVGIS